MKPIGALQMTRWIVHDVLLRCFLLLLVPVYWTLLFSSHLLIAISCLTLRCAQETSALSRKTAGATWRLLIVISRSSRRPHSQKKAASISGT